ncbi:MAG: 6,7-dimethyl-8-ribityllumazine synthase [Bacteroidales bacterium]
MSSAEQNLSQVHRHTTVPSAETMRFGIVVSEWNTDITQALLDGAYKTLVSHGAKEKNIHVKWVPGSYELPLAAQLIADSYKVDAVICLGCVIQGETRHFDFICDAVSNGIMKLNLDYSLPFVFGVLTTNDSAQAKDRAGGKHGNKGDEAALTAIKMINFQKNL